MKSFILLLVLILSSNTAFAKKSCTSLFSEISIAPSKSAPSKDTLKKDLSIVIDKVEALFLEHKLISDVIKIEIPELKSDISAQILKIEKIQQNEKQKNPLIKRLLTKHLQALSESLKKPTTLESHYLLSLRTLLLFDLSIREILQEDAYLLSRKQERVANEYLNGKISELEFIKVFPQLREITSVWNKASKSTTERDRVLLFSTLELSIPDFNRVLSPAVSFVGLVSKPTPADNLGFLNSIEFALHDISHHELYREQYKDWRYVDVIKKRSKLMVESRKMYLEARESLDAKSKLSFDILFFIFNHEQIRTFPDQLQRIYKTTNGLTYESKNISDIELKYLIDMTKTNGFNDKNSNLDTTSLESFKRSFAPHWELMTQVWLKAYEKVLTE